jgi:uncharacterized membrane protein YhaH (DUF805 family)|tara:strand:- start:106651 stop:107049 length:399 start_codon:yes stop_codon:yes gene_type:complete
MNWYLDVLKTKCATFSGRAQRKEYWYFVLFNLIVSAVLVGIDTQVGALNANTGLGVLSGIYCLAVLIPGLAVCIRRLHDTNRSAWWLLITLVPFIGSFVLLFFMVSNSDAETNKYGANPKKQEPEDDSGVTF